MPVLLLALSHLKPVAPPPRPLAAILWWVLLEQRPKALARGRPEGLLDAPSCNGPAERNQ